MIQKIDLIRSKIIGVSQYDQLQRLLSTWKFFNRRIVFTNGCFDLVHLGHIDYLARASDLGSVLVVGLNTDDSVRRIKGTSRPVNKEYARAMVLASMSFVSQVVLFDQDTPFELIRLIVPDVLVKGSDYKPEEIVGYDIVKDNGGEIITMEFLPGYSTTEILGKFLKT